jgi:hypothetical protein
MVPFNDIGEIDGGHKIPVGFEECMPCVLTFFFATPVRCLAL